MGDVAPVQMTETSIPLSDIDHWWADPEGTGRSAPGLVPASAACASPGGRSGDRLPTVGCLSVVAAAETAIAARVVPLSAAAVPPSEVASTLRV